ncbi:uncharacterized protein V6R79_016316 [Siganus canaliculatus]
MKRWQRLVKKKKKKKQPMTVAALPVSVSLPASLRIRPDPTQPCCPCIRSSLRRLRASSPLSGSAEGEWKAAEQREEANGRVVPPCCQG